MKTVYYICGPSGVGKTAFSVALSARVPGLVFINADTMQLYRGIEPLAAHPTAEELSAIEHRLFGVLDPSQPCSRELWLGMAVREIRDVLSSNRIPVLIGGSRSFAACLARAAWGIRLPVDHGNTVTFPEEGDPAPVFPFELRAVILSADTSRLRTSVRRRLAGSVDAAFACLRTALDNGTDLVSPAFWTIGVSELLSVMRGEAGLETVLPVITDRTMRYIEEQTSVFGLLSAELAARWPASLLHLDGHPEGWVAPAGDYIAQDNNGRSTSGSAPREILLMHRPPARTVPADSFMADVAVNVGNTLLSGPGASDGSP